MIEKYQHTMDNQVEIAGYWELGWNTPIKEIDLWEYLVDDFKVGKFYMCPVSGIESKAVVECKDLEVIIQKCLNDGFSLVFVDEKGVSTLEDFSHPNKVLYVFGKASFSPLMSFGSKYNHISIRIETIKNGGLLWPHQAASIVLYDRLIKSRK